MSQSLARFLSTATDEAQTELLLAQWVRMRAKASFAMTVGGDERLMGDVSLSAEELAACEAEAKKGDEPYGDVKYADPGLQKDGKKRYPIDTAEHIRAAWNYINKPANCSKYSPADCAKVKARIVSAWKRVIDSKGPPSAKS